MYYYPIQTILSKDEDLLKKIQKNDETVKKKYMMVTRLMIVLILLFCIKGDGWIVVDEDGSKHIDLEGAVPDLVWKQTLWSHEPDPSPTWGCDARSSFSRLSDSNHGMMREIVASPILIRNDQDELFLVVVSVSGKVVMYDARDGTEVWSIEIAPGEEEETYSIYKMVNGRTRARKSSIKGVVQSPIFDIKRGRIYVSDISGLVVCIRARDGKTVWKRNVGDPDDNKSINLLGGTEFVPRLSVILVPLTNRTLLELDAETGISRRMWHLSDRIMSTPISLHHTYNDGVTYYVTTWDGTLYAINGKSGERRWDADLGELVESSPIVVSAEDMSDVDMFVSHKESSEDHEYETYQILSVIYVKSTLGSLFRVAHVLKVSDKSEHSAKALFKSEALSSEMPSFDRIQSKRSDLVSSTPRFDKQNQAVLVLSTNGDIHSVDMLRDSKRWSRRLFNDKHIATYFTASPSRFGNLVMFGNWGGNLYGISSKDGSLRWLKQTCGGTTSSVVSAQIQSKSDAVVVRSFALTYTGEILAFDLRQPNEVRKRRREFQRNTRKTRSIQDWIHSKLFDVEECPVNDSSAKYIVFENPLHDWGIASFIHILVRLVLDVLEKDESNKTFFILDNIQSVYVSRMNCKERPSILCMLRPLSPCNLLDVRKAETSGARIEYVVVCSPLL